MEFTETVLILRIGRFREADIWVKFFSPKRGLLTAFAFGGSRSRRRFCGCLDPLNQVQFRIKSNRRGTYLNLEEGSLVESPSRLRRDWNRMGLAANCTRFVEEVPVAPESTQTMHGLLLDTVRFLDTEEDVVAIFPMLFRARVAFDQGFAPEVDTCVACGMPFTGEGEASFFVEEGRAVCPACLSGKRAVEDVVRQDGIRFPVSPVTLRTLAYVRDHPVADWKFLRFSPRVLRECAQLIDGFIQFHLGLEWDRGGYRRV